MLCQQRHIFTALPKRRQAQANHVQPVVQVLAEQPLLDTLVQILVRCGDDAHIRRQRRMPTDPVELSIRQHAQKTRLQFRRHIADFIEEQRPALCLLKAASPHHRRTGEGASLVSKQFALKQVLRDGGGIDRHKWFQSPLAVPVQGVGH